MLSILKHKVSSKKYKLETDIDMICMELPSISSNYINLQEYIKDKKLNNVEILTIIKRVVNIFEYIESKGEVVCSVNLSDFWIKDNSLDKMTYKINRRLLEYNDNLLNYEKGELYSP